MSVEPIRPETGRLDDELGIWMRLRAPFPEPRPALFLDRDGVIVEDPGYLSRVVDMVMIPGASEIIASANRLGVPVIEVTNQAGIARGHYEWREFLEVESALAHELAKDGAVVDAAFACPFHRDGVPPWAHPAHPARKPRPGMLLAAARLLNLDLSRSWIVGDQEGDLAAGRNAGLRGGFHVLTGHGREQRQTVLGGRAEAFDLRLGDSIRDAAPLLDLIAWRG
jgi:D-glycero-D-manno-heptose 1,7-bisphosphate phosphatase